MSFAKSISSLDTWSSEDQSFTKYILLQGTCNTSPNDGSFCTVLFTLIDQEEIEQEKLGNYVLDQKTDLTIGEGDTVLSEMLDKVLMSMKEGEQCYVKANCDVNGNKLGAIDREEMKLKFKLHLFSLSRSADIAELLVDEKLEKAEHHKTKGTEIYNKNLHYSLERFKKALFFLKAIPLKRSNTSQQKQIKKLKLQCYLNIAAGMLINHQYEKVITHCDSALQLDPCNVKGLFRRAQAFHNLQKYKEAIEDLKDALDIESDNRAIYSLLKTVEAASKKEKMMYQKMFT